MSGRDAALRLAPPRPVGAAAALGALVLLLAILALALGPVPIPAERAIEALLGGGDAAEGAIVRGVRAPRLLLGLATGVTLALSGAALQGLLRNPLADPGLVGVTAGASLGAVSAIVLGAAFAAGLPAALRPYLLPLAAFAGAAAATALLFALARRRGETGTATLILVGVALNAVAMALIGLLVYLSDDRELRQLSLWSLGTLGGADWTLVLVVAALAALAAPVLLAATRALDLLQLGERAAFHAGVEVERLKRRLGLAVALGVGAATAAAGPIGFVGLVAPHLARLTVGPAHGRLMPVAALYGAALVLIADLAVRLVAPPAEPPIGLALSLVGGPFFLWLILRRRAGA